MISLIELLKELGLSDHYKERKGQRGNIYKLSIPQEAYGDYNVEETNTKLIDILKNELFGRLSRIEGINIEASFTYPVGYKIFKPVLFSNNKNYPITMYATYEEEGIVKEDSGNLYFGLIRDNKFVTLMLSNDIDDIDLEKKIINHIRRKNPKLKSDIEPKILSTFDYIYDIDIDKIYGKTIAKEIPTEDSVDYTVRTDYRKGASFTHKKYGEGTVATTSAGSGGKGDTNGRLDWVDVDFRIPFLKGGVLTTIRRIAPVYTKIYFDTYKKK
jgi:hypothetical protein